MPYRMTYFRIRSNNYDRGWSSDREQDAFETESRQIFQTSGWKLHKGKDRICDTLAKDQQELYLHPMFFSGVVDEAEVPSLLEQLSAAKTFQCYHVDHYEEYIDLSDEEYWAALEAKRDEVTNFILENCRTKRTNLYIVDSVPDRIAQQFEICRLCDKDRRNSVGLRFTSELIDQLPQQGRMVTAETDRGPGIRTATAKEMGSCRQQPKGQLDGQISMMF